jgi:hypothetical protein
VNDEPNLTGRSFAMILASRLLDIALLAMVAASCPHPLFAFHAGFVDARGESVFSAEFVHDYQSADNASITTRSVKPFLELFSKYKQPNERAELELTIGVIYAQRTGHVDPAKAVKHLTNALNYQLPDETYLNALLWRAGSFEQLGKLDEARVDHLRGLLACSYYQLPLEWPEAKEPISPISIGSDVDDADAQRRRDYYAYRARIKLQQAILMQQFYFIDGLKRISSRSPLDQDQLRKVLGDLTPDERKHELLLRLLQSGNKRPWP